MIPKELKALRQWTYSFSDSEPKRPTHYNYEPDGALTYEDAVARAIGGRSFGLYVTKDDPYILGDIDHVNPDDPFPMLPAGLTYLLRSYPTYCEASPSNTGVRFVYRLRDVSEKQVVSGFYFKNAEKMEYDEASNKTREAQVNFGPPWMRFTGRETPYSSSAIAGITLADLEGVFKLRQADVKEKDIRERLIVDRADLPPMSHVLAALTSLPLDQNPRIIRAYEATFNETYAHYAFWLKIMMAVHNYAELTNTGIECLNAIIEWSKTDEVAYQGEEDIHKHWRSFNVKEDFISYKSLFGVATHYRLFWPRPKKKKEGEPFTPMITEYVNFRALVDHYAVKLFRDETVPDVIYVSADTDIISKYFMMIGVREVFGKYYGPFSKDTLVPALYRMCQDQGFYGIGHGVIAQFVKTYLAESVQTVNFIRMFFDTPFDKLPPAYQENADFRDESTVDTLYEALTIDFTSKTERERDEEDKLYYTYYRSWLMGFVRNLYMQDSPHMNNCILLLTGPEQIRKTSHFRYMLPTFMRDKIAFTTHGFANEGSMRDVVKLSSSNLLIVWDEIEQYLSAETESNFKKIIDNNPQKIIDKYEVIEKTIRPTAVYGGTSNQREFRLGAEGSRRLFNIPVKWVDTDLMAKVCWHKLINDLRQEMEMETRAGRIPWLLTEEQLELQRSYHSRMRSKNTLDVVLAELFAFDEPLHLTDDGFLPGATSLQNSNGRLMSTKDVCDTLTSYGFGQLAVKRPAVIKTLERMCSDYTNTQRTAIKLSMPKCKVSRGMAVQGPHSKWVMPPMRTDVHGTTFQQFV